MGASQRGHAVVPAAMRIPQDEQVRSCVSERGAATCAAGAAGGVDTGGTGVGCTASAGAATWRIAVDGVDAGAGVFG